MSDGLSDKQLTAIDLMLTGENIAAIAKNIGVVRETVYRWQMLPAFQAHLAARRAVIHGQVLDRLCDLIPKALTLMERAIEREAVKDTPDWRVAAKVLDLVTKMGPQMPMIDVAATGEGESGGVEVVDLDGPPTVRFRSMAELRKRNVQSWEAAGQPMPNAVAPGAGEG